MVEHLMEIIRRNRAGDALRADFELDLDNLEVAVINTLYDIENLIQRLNLESGRTTERAHLLEDAKAFAKRAQKVIKVSRAVPSDAALAEARTWLQHAREILAKAPGSCLDLPLAG